MKATGIVRRIDELGRLVIPKEMRKKYHLNEGDSVEFFINDNEEIILKKYSVLSEWETMTGQILKTLAEIVQNPVFFMHKDVFEMTGRSVYGDYLNKPLSAECLKACKVYTNQQFADLPLFANEAVKGSGYVFPIAVYGDWLASLVVLENKHPMSAADVQTVDAFKKFMIHQQEK